MDNDWVVRGLPVKWQPYMIVVFPIIDDDNATTELVIRDLHWFQSYQDKKENNKNK